MRKYGYKLGLASALFLSCMSSMLIADDWYTETLIDDWRQTFHVEETLYEEKTSQQHLMILNTIHLHYIKLPLLCLSS